MGEKSSDDISWVHTRREEKATILNSKSFKPKANNIINMVRSILYDNITNTIWSAIYDYNIANTT